MGEEVGKCWSIFFCLQFLKKSVNILKVLTEGLYALHFYSYRTERGTSKNVTFSRTDSWKGRAIEVQKENNLPHRSVLRCNWPAEACFWFLGRKNKTVQTDELVQLHGDGARLLENEYSEPIQKLEQQESSGNWVFSSVTHFTSLRQQNNLPVRPSFILLFYHWKYCSRSSVMVRRRSLWL